MDSAKLVKNFEKHGFSVKLFETRKEACDYLKETLKGEVVGFGGSMTTQELGLYDLLGEENTVCWHWKDPSVLAKQGGFTAYITSANAVSETGELVNIDGTGNRVAATLYGPKKVFFVCGKNKVTADLPSAIDRARNIAAPINAKRLNSNTPCAVAGKCMDCDSPERICRGMVVQMRKMGGADLNELIIINEDLGA